MLDGILTGYELFRIGYAAQASDAAYRRSPIPRGTDLALGAASAALFLSSAIYGVVNTSACHRLKHGPVLGEDMPGITREPEPELPAPVDPAFEPGPATTAQPAPTSPPRTPAPASAAGGSLPPP